MAPRVGGGLGAGESAPRRWALQGGGGRPDFEPISLPSPPWGGRGRPCGYVGVWGRGPLVPGLLRSLHQGLGSGLGRLHLCVELCLAPAYPMVGEHSVLLCPGAGTPNEEQEQDSLHPHPMATGSSILVSAPSYLSSQTGVQGHERLWFLCGLLLRIQFPDARQFPPPGPSMGR